MSLRIRLECRKRAAPDPVSILAALVEAIATRRQMWDLTGEAVSERTDLIAQKEAPAIRLTGAA